MRNPNTGDFIWDDAAIAQLTELWLSGNTSSECGRALGVSRSAAIGKLGRLGLLRQTRPRMPIVRRSTPLLKNARNIEQVSKRLNKQPLPPPVRFQPPPPPPLPTYGTLNLLDLRYDSCRWPEGERPDYRFCGRPRHHESSYCPEHARLSLSHGSQRDFDRAAEQALAGKLFASRAGMEQ